MLVSATKLSSPGIYPNLLMKTGKKLGTQTRAPCSELKLEVKRKSVPSNIFSKVHICKNCVPLIINAPRQGVNKQRIRL